MDPAKESDSRPKDEIQAIKDRYERRSQKPLATLYDPLDPYVYMARQDRERRLIRCLKKVGQVPVAQKRVLELGCGTGGNLIELIRLGFKPANLVGNDLLEERVAIARATLPSSVALHVGDASTLDLGDESFDIVLQVTVFSSILDDALQNRLAARMWSLTRPGGGILWHDFVWNNPRNPDVRGVPAGRIRGLFPGGRVQRWPVTLAPPLGRRLCRISPSLYTVANAFPFLRTHLLCWIQKPYPEASPQGPGSSRETVE